MKMHQEMQFAPTRKSISIVLSGYGYILKGYKIADSGIENCTIIIESSAGKYILRVYRQQRKSDADIQRELDFVIYLGANHIPIAPPIAKPDGSYISHINQTGFTWQAILMQHMPGQHSEHYTNKLLLNLAAMQARMHNLAGQYNANGTQNENLIELRESQFVKLIQTREKLDPIFQGFVDRAESYVVNLDGNLPRGLCHLDFDNGNILSENEVITAVLDFDDLKFAPYAMCLAYTLWDIAFGLGLGIVAKYIKNYEKFRPLTIPEQSLIKPIMLTRHYSIGCKEIADKQMDSELLIRYLELEKELLNPRVSIM